MNQDGHEPKRKGDERKGMCAYALQENRPKHYAKDEADDDERVVPRLGQARRVGTAHPQICGIRPAPQVAGTHRRRERQAMHPAERLDLQGADKRYQRRHRKVERPARQQGHHGQKRSLDPQDYLVPSETTGMSIASMDHVREHNAHTVGEYGAYAMRRATHIARRQPKPQYHQVARHGVREHAATEQV